MKIALVSSATTYWLAGQVGVSERVHSSADRLEFGGDIIVQPQERVRARHMAFRDRKNYSASVSFRTTRKFTTLTDAEAFAATYDALYPRTGFLEFYGADDILIATLQNAVLRPPTRIVTGVSVEMTYSAVGGEWTVEESYSSIITMGGEAVTMPTL